MKYWRILQMDLSHALESLPPHYLQIILLRDFEELSLQEISQRTGETIACIKSRLHRARIMVREYLVTPRVNREASNHDKPTY